mgnify:CR=1 FL=1
MRLSTYEGMFLFDPNVATQWETVEKEIGRIMQRAGAELIGIKRWDERRLAYEIKHRKRACYVLTYFRSPASNIAGIERDARLSEMILRLLVLRCHLSEEELAAFGRESAEQSALLRNGAAAGVGKGTKSPAEVPPGTEAEAEVGPGAGEPDAEQQRPDRTLDREDGIGEEVTRAEAEALWADRDDGTKESEK